MRGKDINNALNQQCARITPAYAGKRSSFYRMVVEARDHPRVCGEKPNRLLWEHWKQGSPPHMRGKEVRHLVEVSFIGITPAYAGKREKARWKK